MGMLLCILLGTSALLGQEAYRPLAPAWNTA